MKTSAFPDANMPHASPMQKYKVKIATFQRQRVRFTEIDEPFQLVAASECLAKEFAVLEFGNASDADVLRAFDGFSAKIDHFLKDERSRSGRETFFGGQVVQTAGNGLQITWPHMFAGVKSEQ